jgi:hypothetical protein
MLTLLKHIFTKFRRNTVRDVSDVERALEKAIGPMQDMVGHAARPLALGGFADVAWFQSDPRLGVVCATIELSLCDSQKPNEGGRYELAIATPQKDSAAANIISRLGRYTLDAVLEDGHTIDIEGAQPKGSPLSALLFLNFVRLDVPDAPVNVLERDEF